MDDRLATFMEQRPRLLRLAYRYLETAADAEDVVQDAWLRYCRVEAPHHAGKLLTTIVTRLALDKLRSAAHRRETYVGEWLPEPLADTAEPDPAALDISYAVMACLKALGPAERAAYFLHDIYDMSFADIAETIGHSPANCRKLAQRARAALAAAKPRFRPTQHDLARFVHAFDASNSSGNLAPLKALLAEGVEFVSDGGGKAAAATHIIRGPDAVARLMLGLARKREHEQLAYAIRSVNGDPAIAIRAGGGLDAIVSFSLDAAGRVNGLYVVRNPDKLQRLQ
ncbi:MAG: RNA polymerase sigma factor SigJ [Rhodoferax sp.]|nr:RNA polymerase sigma factor SigJ [Rhodoferax sp.]